MAKPKLKPKINEEVKVTAKKDKPPSALKGIKVKRDTSLFAKPVGQPSKLEEKAPIIIAAIRRGNTYENSCMLANISYSSFCAWTRKGRESREASQHTCKYLIFLDAVEKAESACEDEILQHWRDCIPGNWQAGKEYLARKNPEKWGNRERVDMNSTVEISQKAILELPDNGER